MTKETRKILKELKLIANHEDSFQIQGGKHMKVRGNAINDHGEVVRLRFILSHRPGDMNWTHQFRREVRKYLSEREVSNVYGF